jgi:uncharacterized protein (UPF0218 family)
LPGLVSTPVCLPRRLRGVLAAPPPGSQLLADTRLMPQLRYSCIISVGDYVTLRLLEAGIRPWAAVVDCRSQRRGDEESCRRILAALDAPVERVANPPGSIRPEAAAAVGRAAREGGVVLVEGEEDLLALVAIVAAPQGCVAVYGYPGVASLVVPVTWWVKRSATRILSEFEPCGPKS